MPVIIKPNGKELEVNENAIKAIQGGELKGFKIKASPKKPVKKAS